MFVLLFFVVFFFFFFFLGGGGGGVKVHTFYFHFTVSARLQKQCFTHHCNILIAK